mmetsp:Transcript_14871/g.51814  ORF Transcript_14871/g.51814 Transcript_14871/m.51814 type:complete len:86 (+) Transcript_14871:594-851(+)
MMRKSNKGAKAPAPKAPDHEWRYLLPTRLHLILRELEPHQPRMTMAELIAFAKSGASGAALLSPARGRTRGARRRSTRPRQGSLV